MEVSLSPELQAKLARIAAKHGRDTEALVIEAVERMISYDEWLLREVKVGIEAADRGELRDYEEVRKLIDQRYPG
jgi:predicted transcriptional regulator